MHSQQCVVELIEGAVQSIVLEYRIMIIIIIIIVVLNTDNINYNNTKY